MVEILIAENAGDKLINIKQTELVSGKGIVGDRYYNKLGTFYEKLKNTGDFEVTLIECEEILAFNTETNLSLIGSDFRRNIVTNDIRLNNLVGKSFKIGEVEFQGVRLCQPCKYLVSILGKVVMEKMMDKCGLRAIIVKSGNISINDSIS
ncbi:MAG: MOSC domain-containing protein [Shewanella sp.]